ncbi:hypothetical protein shim_38450 [Shimia sp. SK013]|uniref:DUF3833 domain-containing protein n=1 Tax=Shimia sp. SK013 TaxID=1389006 RepID=UPI0006B45D5B|nr:DUF3833 domain-containing protein [Shimia sp. SK013]KPA19886.1 hypothetical protein shim_38450 [Shimia sp. SK013]
MKLLSLFFFSVVCLAVAKQMFWSFRAQTPKNYAETKPAFSLKQHLSGEILSEGIIFGPNGKMTNSFVAKMYGTWEGDTGRLSEDFTYSNGTKQARKWYLKLGENGAFTATADDIVGEASGQVSGSTVKMQYKIVLPEQAGGQTLDVTDWLYLTENGTIMNKSELRKFGLKVAELNATMRSVDQHSD